MREKSFMLVIDQSYSPIESLENEELYRHAWRYLVSAIDEPTTLTYICKLNE